MTEILEIGYSAKLALTKSFDLNIIRNMLLVKDNGKAYIPDEDTQMSLIFNRTVIVEPAAVEENRVTVAEERADNLHRWWKEEKTKAEELRKELDCLKLQLQQLIPEPKKETKNENDLQCMPKAVKVQD